jgi:hypothetical protein
MFLKWLEGHIRRVEFWETSEGSGEVSADLALSLTQTRLSEERCAELVFLIGEALAEIVKSPGG